MPTPQAAPMVSLDELTAFLRQRNPNMDREATLAGFGQIGGGTRAAGGMLAIPTPTPEILTTVNPPTTVLTSSTPTPKKPSPTVTAPLETSKPSPKQPQIEPLAASPLSAYQDPYQKEAEEKESEEKEKESEKVEGIPVAEPIPEDERIEKVDLNETARKQGLMTDEEFQSFLDGVNRRDEETVEMVEGLDLASRAVGVGGTSGVTDLSDDVVHQSVAEVDERKTEKEVSESVTSQPGAREDDEQTEETDAEVPTEEPESVAPSITKPKAVNRRLVLKDDPKAERQKPKRVS